MHLWYKHQKWAVAVFAWPGLSRPLPPAVALPAACHRAGLPMASLSYGRLPLVLLELLKSRVKCAPSPSLGARERFPCLPTIFTAPCTGIAHCGAVNAHSSPRGRNSTSTIAILPLTPRLNVARIFVLPYSTISSASSSKAVLNYLSCWLPSMSLFSEVGPCSCCCCPSHLASFWKRQNQRRSLLQLNGLVI